MPPIYHFEKKVNKVDEIQISNLPLGGLMSEDFTVLDKKFSKGDVLVMDEINIDIIKESIEEESLFIKELIDKVHEVIVGQKDLVQKLIKSKHFLMLLPDDLIIKKNCSLAMMKLHKKHNSSTPRYDFDLESELNY